MKIDLVKLIYEVQEKGEDIGRYYIEAHKYPPHKEIMWHERNSHHAENFVCDISTIMGLDIDRLYAMARAVRKWEMKHDWNRCFPIEENKEAILRYLEADK